ncbi:MAG TPA: glycosyltransferase family 39 protein [bacterium]|nr:glycosyltransferase family 39 protein [bacterium]
MAHRSTAVVLGLIAAAAVLQVVGAARVPVPVHYDYDEGVYAATADAVGHGGRLYQDVFVSQPPVLILTIRGMFALLGTSLPVARSTVVLSSALWLIAILAMLVARGCPWGGALAVCLLIGRPVFLVMARTVEMEVPSEALACAAFALAAWGARRPGPVWWAGAGALAVLALMTKLTAATCLLPLAGAAITHGPALGRRLALMAAGAVLATGVLLPFIATAGFLDQVFAFHVVLARAHPQSPLTHAATIARFLTSQWPVSAAGAFGLWWSIRSGTWLDRALVVWLAADCAVLIGLTPLWEHHLIILMSPLALLAGKALDRIGVWIARSGEGARLATRAGLAAVIAAYLIWGVSAVPKPASSGELERAVAQIGGAVPAGGKILTDDPMVAFLARRPLAAGLVDTSLARIWAGEITEAKLLPLLHENGTDAVVFWRGTFRAYFPRLEPAAASLFPVAVAARGGRVLLFKVPPVLGRP